MDSSSSGRRITCVLADTIVGKDSMLSSKVIMFILLYGSMQRNSDVVFPCSMRQL